MEGQDRMRPPRFISAAATRLWRNFEVVLLAVAATLAVVPFGRLYADHHYLVLAGGAAVVAAVVSLIVSPAAAGAGGHRGGPGGGLPLPGHHGVPFPATGGGLGRCDPELVDTPDRLSSHAQHFDLRGASGGADRGRHLGRRRAGAALAGGRLVRS